MAMTEFRLCIDKDHCTSATWSARESSWRFAFVGLNPEVAMDGITSTTSSGNCLHGSEAVRPQKETEEQAQRGSWRVKKWAAREREALLRTTTTMSSEGCPRDVRPLKWGTISVHREWCEVCDAAHDTGAQHQHRRMKRQVEQEQRRPRIF